MARGSYLKGPNYVHPEKDSAVGSRNSLNRDGRNEYGESKLIMDEEVDKILNHVSAKLPPEVLEKLHVGGTVKEILHNYFNQSYQNMYNRYMVTVEDEMSKKFRNLVDREEASNLNKYAPRDIAFLMDSIGADQTFNTNTIENSIVNIFSHLQGHVQKGVYTLENSTEKMLNGQTNVGGFLRGEFANSVVKCSFSNNPLKPEAVTDVNLTLNIPESDLIHPIYHYQAASETIIKDIISEHILNLIDKEVDKINTDLIDSKQDELNESRRIFEKFKKLENHIGFDEATADSPQYAHIAKKFLDAIKGIAVDASQADLDQLDVRENVIKIIDDENIRDRGFNDAVNKLVGILDMTLLGYQHIENFKNCRKMVIREYEDTKTSVLPDEHYTITAAYLDDTQLREMRTAYCQQMEEFEAEATKLTKVFEKIFTTEKVERGFVDYNDISNEILAEVRGKKIKTSIPDKIPRAELWDEIIFIQPEKNDIEKMNETFASQRRHLVKRYKSLRSRITELYENDNPPERVIMEQRLDFLEDQTEEFSQKYNPFQVFPGLFVEVCVSSINRRGNTIDGMGNVLTQFLNELSKDIPDFAYKEYHEKRSEQEKEDNSFASAV